MDTNFNVDDFLANLAGKPLIEQVKRVRALRLTERPDVAALLMNRPEFRTICSHFTSASKNPDSFFTHWLTVQAVLQQAENALKVFTLNAKLRELDPKAIEQAERAVLAIEDVKV